MQRVYVGLSGGVDSAVSAALLIERGYDVVGTFIKIWRPEFIECTWKEDRLDAMRVCAALNIPFREIDLSEEYKREVVDSMVRDYTKGVTPNPDVLCNREIKFGSFFRWARADGADFIATGHYARVVENKGIFELHRGRDASKDQSYFLHQIEGSELSRVLFPVSELEKAEVRALAQKFDLPVAKRPDSQGLCFIGDVTMSEFLGRYIVLKSGRVIDTVGRVIGEHDGAALYTIGQRHGFKTVNSGLPYYVTSIDTGSNTVTVSHVREDGAVKVAHVNDMHWLGQQTVPARAQDQQTVPARAFAQTRYREAAVPVVIRKVPNGWDFVFDQPHIAAPGQALVLYDGDKCLGGGSVTQQ